MPAMTAEVCSSSASVTPASSMPSDRPATRFAVPCRLIMFVLHEAAWPVSALLGDESLPGSDTLLSLPRQNAKRRPWRRRRGSRSWVLDDQGGGYALMERERGYVYANECDRAYGPASAARVRPAE